MPVRRSPCRGRQVDCLALALIWSGVLAPPGRAGQHPTLLITPESIPRLRHACGVDAPATDTEDLGRAGARARDFQALRAYFADRVGTAALPGELLGAAFLHLVAPHDPLDAQRIELINRALISPPGTASDALETLVALDWCWEALEPAARREFLLALAQRAAPLTPADSPLDHRVFRQKLSALAAALAVDAQDEPSAAWTAVRRRVLAAAREYFETTFPVFVQWRGLAPTSPSTGPWEERDTALAVELASTLLERDLWPEYRHTVGRWLEHYVYASFAHPALQHHFIRDDGTYAPLSPAPQWDELLPLSAHLIAARTGDPAAAFVARRVEQRLRGPAADPLAVPWQWVPIVFETSHIPCCNFARLPPARNFGGAVVFRGGQDTRETGIWIEAGQPFLRRRQHYDAGHFLIYSGGQLAVGGGDDIAFEAVTSKSGSQHLGDRKDPFDFEQYFAATIAHNCLVLWDPVRVPRWYGNRYEPVGGQRLVEDTCTDFTAPLAGHPRETARQLAYGQHDTTCYLALDLAPAYEPRVTPSYTRELVFFGGQVLVVIDRIALAQGQCEPVWVVNIPARPTVDGDELSDEARTAGSTNEAGVWRYDDARWLRWCDHDGVLWMTSLLPSPGQLRVVGGPATKSTIPAGPHAGREYLGGDADGFERRVRPSGKPRAQNAWYRLGQPTLLGPAFGQTPHWGRIEIEPPERRKEYVFATIFVIQSGGAAAVPSATVEASAGGIEITAGLADQRTVLRLPVGSACGGTIQRPQEDTWTLPTAVEPDPALPAS